MTDTLTRSLSDVLSDFRFAMLATADADGKTVTLALGDPKGNAFVSVTGTARLTHDTGLIERLYDAETDAFFEGKDDPRLRVLTVEATAGEWWDGPAGQRPQRTRDTVRSECAAGRSRATRSRW